MRKIILILFIFVPIVSFGQIPLGIISSQALDTIPCAVTGLTATSATSTTISISWNGCSGSDPTDHYYVFWKKHTNVTGTGVDVYPPTTTYTITGLSSLTTYDITVQAYDVYGNGGTADSISYFTTH